MAPVSSGGFNGRTALSEGSPGGSPSGLWRISDRATFRALRSSRRVRRGPISVTYLSAGPSIAPTPPRVAFAVAKTAGGAVVRNRIRRRLRAALRDLQVRGGLPAGSYLLGGGAELARLPWSELVSDLEAAITAATEAAS